MIFYENDGINGNMILNENEYSFKAHNESLDQILPLEKQFSEEEENFEGNMHDIELKPNTELTELFKNENSDKKTKLTTVTSGFIEKNVTFTPILFWNDTKEEPKQYLVKKRGRKLMKKEKIFSEEKSHTKLKEDNIMRKIKTHFMDFTVKLLNDSLIDKTYIFFKIDKAVSENLKKDFNMKLMETTLSFLFSTSQVNKRYKKHSEANKTLIKKIFEEKKEVKTMELLQKTYIEMINLIKEKYLEEYLATIEAKEIDIKNPNIGSYLDSLKNIFSNYENWFKNKIGRQRGGKSETFKE